MDVYKYISSSRFKSGRVVVDESRLPFLPTSVLEKGIKDKMIKKIKPLKNNKDARRNNSNSSGTKEV